MNKKDKIFNYIVHIYLVLFIFSAINKEFLFFKIDLRYIVLPLAIFILGVSILKRHLKIAIDKTDYLGNSIIIFYIIVLVSNLMWIINGLQANDKAILNENILILNVLLAVLVIYFNKERYNMEIINITIIVSSIILGISMILVHGGLSLEQIMGTPNTPYIYYSSPGVTNTNLYGENYRCAGYASDPNYATILLLMAIVVSLKSKRTNKLIKGILTTFYCLCIGLSFSKSIIVASLICILYVIFIKKTKIKTKNIKIINRSFIFILLLIEFIIPFIQEYLNFLPNTLTTRFEMWKYAKELFVKNPIIGNGLTSFRSYFAISHWYVQVHSTYWQVISETGLIGIIAYINVVVKALDKSAKNNTYDYFLILVFLIWIMTCESIALQFSICILYMLNSKEKIKKEEIKNE